MQRTYPYLLVKSDPHLVFPAAEGYQDIATDTYYASGFLQGETSGRRYAFLTIFAKNGEIFDLLSADLHMLALFDLASGTYDTGSRFDLPRPSSFDGRAGKRRARGVCIIILLLVTGVVRRGW